MLLNELGITPSVYHMNEGHSAFLILERIRSLMNGYHLSFEEAGEIVRSSCVFTTHTPVDAGNERFRNELIEFLRASHADVLKKIHDDAKFTPESEAALNAAIDAFKAQFVA